MTKFEAPDATASSEEVALTAKDILVSATDARGVITYANQVFSTIAQYDQQELLGAPHRIVRHPDMPKGVFSLAWDKLHAGKSVGAYVKNRTKGGAYYWVFAAITAQRDGYLSVRIRPDSAFFDSAKSLYETLLEQERADLSPDQSAQVLRDLLKEAGFATYTEFMEAALDAEVTQRCQALGKVDKQFQEIEALSAIVGTMNELVSDVETGFDQVRGEPVNLRILAGRLEGAGAALGTISQNYDAMARDMYTLVSALHNDRGGALTQMARAINRGRSALQVSWLMQDAADLVTQMETENAPGIAMLRDHQQKLHTQGQKALSAIAATSKPIPDICRRVRRRINGLDVVKLLCKVESGRLRDTDSGLDGIIHRLEQFHGQTDQHLAELLTKATQITQKSAAL